MNIKIINEKINALELICTNPDKLYRFCSTAEQACYINEDYIYLPLGEYYESPQEFFDEIKLHLENSYCKGFFINYDLFKFEKNHVFFHNTMKEFSSKIEVLSIVRNVYNAAITISEINIEKYKPQIISIAGSDEKAPLVNIISYILSKKGKTLSSISSNGPWQKFIEPLLVIDKNTKYCVLDIDPSKSGISKYASNICKNNTVAFTKTSFNWTARYKDAQGYLDEVTGIIDCTPNICNVFTFEENDLVNSNLKQCDCLNVIEESKIESSVEYVRFFNKPFTKIKYESLVLKTFNFEYYMPRCAVMAAKVLQSLGIKDKTIQDCMLKFYDVSGIYTENKIGLNSYSVLCTKEHTPFGVKNALKCFNQKYKNHKKILVLSRIAGLNECFSAIHKDIVKEAAQCGFSAVVLIDMSDYGAYYKIYDKMALIKKVSSKNNRLEEKELINIGLFIKGEVTDNTAILVCTRESLNLSFLF